MTLNKIGRSKQAKLNNSITTREGHAAINVKVYNLITPEGVSEQSASTAYDWAVDQFWNDATVIAHERGYAGIFAEGRSGGWCVPYGWTKRDVQHTYGGAYSQGPAVGYPVYPDVEHDGADRERFRGFQRAIRHLLADVQEMYTNNCKEFADEN